MLLSAQGPAAASAASSPEEPDGDWEEQQWRLTAMFAKMYDGERGGSDDDGGDLLMANDDLSDGETAAEAAEAQRDATLPEALNRASRENATAAAAAVLAAQAAAPVELPADFAAAARRMPPAARRALLIEEGVAPPPEPTGAPDDGASPHDVGGTAGEAAAGREAAAEAAPAPGLTASAPPPRADALLAALGVDDSSRASDVLRATGIISPGGCTALRRAVDERRSVSLDSVDLAAEHQLNLGVHELVALVGADDLSKLLGLPARLAAQRARDAASAGRGVTPGRAAARLEVLVRRYSRSTRPWIEFHRDRAAYTVNVALADDSAHDGGRLVCVVDGRLVPYERCEGEATCHTASVLHAVTAMQGSTVRYSCVCFFHADDDGGDGP